MLETLGRYHFLTADASLSATNRDWWKRFGGRLQPGSFAFAESAAAASAAASAGQGYLASSRSSRMQLRRVCFCCCCCIVRGFPVLFGARYLHFIRTLTQRIFLSKRHVQIAFKWRREQFNLLPIPTTALAGAGLLILCST